MSGVVRQPTDSFTVWLPKTTADHLYTKLVELVKKHYNLGPLPLLNNSNLILMCNNRVKQWLSMLQSCISSLNTMTSKTPWKIHFWTGWCGASLPAAHSIVCYFCIKYVT